MKNFSTVSNTSVNAGSVKGAQYHVPGHGMQSDIESESLSDDFNEALVPWLGRIHASGGSRIGKSWYAAHDGAIESSTANRRDRAVSESGNMSRIHWRQAGFFDLGISLLILALSGGTVYAIEKTHSNSVASAPESVVIAADRHPQHGADKLANADVDVSDLAL